MAYLTSQNVTDRFAHVKAWTDDNLDGTIDSSLITEAISLAEGAIDRYAAQQYAVPLALTNSSVAKMIKDAAGAVAGYRLASRIWETVPENLKQEYDTAIAWLETVAAGKVYLPGESPASAPKPSGGIIIGGADAIVTRETMDGL